MKTFRYGAATWFCTSTLALLVLLMFSSLSSASDVRNLWQSRDQFVALERQDSSGSGDSIANDHPAEINPDRLSALLASIDVRSEDSGRPERLFTNESLEALVPQMVKGFHQAAAGEDVTFAIIGLYKAMYGFAKSPKVTTGRAFYKSGRLNIIFGFVRKDFNEREDRRLSPLTPGSRQNSIEGEWTVLPQSALNGFSLVRKDWMVFSDVWQAPVAIPPVIEQNNPKVQTTPAQPVNEQNPPKVQTTPAQPVKQPIDTRSPAERLITLNELKNKGLISDEEYRNKRMEIMNGL